MSPLSGPPPLPAPRNTVSRTAAAWFLWMAASLAVSITKCPRALAPLLPGDPDQPLLFVLAAGVLFLILVAPPLWGDPPRGRGERLSEIFGAALLMAGTLVFVTAFASRLAPLPARALRADVLFLLFSLFSLLLFRATPRFYVVIQGGLFGGGALAAWFLGEFSLARGGDTAWPSALAATNIFRLLDDASPGRDESMTALGIMTAGLLAWTVLRATGTPHAAESPRD